MTKEKYIDIDKETNNEQLTKRKLTVLKVNTFELCL